jgi:DNA-binding beta-propeller fold protein YncE
MSAGLAPAGMAASFAALGQRPRGIELTKDGKFILVAVGDDDTIQMIDTSHP